MPAGHDDIRSRYFSGRTHPNRATKKKTGFEGNNWPSTRTFYSDISLDVVILSKKLIYYRKRSRLDKLVKKKNVAVFLEGISRDIGFYVSNYTISGMLSEKWGPRHNPTEKTKEALYLLCEWLERYCRKIGTWKPFTFKLHQSDLVSAKQTQKQHEEETQKARYKKACRQKARQEEKRWANQFGYEASYPSKSRQHDPPFRILGKVGGKVQD